MNLRYVLFGALGAILATEACADAVTGTWTGQIHYDWPQVFANVPAGQPQALRAKLERNATTLYIATFKPNKDFVLTTMPHSGVAKRDPGWWGYESKGGPQLKAWNKSKTERLFKFSPDGKTLTADYHGLAKSGVSIVFHRTKMAKLTRREREVVGRWNAHADFDESWNDKNQPENADMAELLATMRRDATYAIEFKPDGTFQRRYSGDKPAEQGIWIDCWDAIYMLHPAPGFNFKTQKSTAIGLQSETGPWSLHGTELEFVPSFDSPAKIGGRYQDDGYVMQKASTMTRPKKADFVGRWNLKNEFKPADENPANYLEIAKSMRAAKRKLTLHYAKCCAAALVSYSEENEKFPANDGQAVEALFKYEKNRDVWKSFSYTYEGGPITQIKDPAMTEVGFVIGENGRAVIFATGDVTWRPDPAFDETKSLQQDAAEYGELVKGLKAERATIDVFSNGTAKIKFGKSGTIFGGSDWEVKWIVQGNTITLSDKSSSVKRTSKSIESASMSVTFGPYTIEVPGRRWVQAHTQAPPFRTVITRERPKGR